MRGLLKNNKGYMLVEIILASALAFGVSFFLLSLIIKIKNKNDDMMVKTEISVDQTIITNKLMTYARDLQSDFKCNNIVIDKVDKTIKYAENDSTTVLISKLSDYTEIGDLQCDVTKDYVKIYLPLNVKQLPNETNDIDIFYKIKKQECIMYDDLILRNGSSSPVFTYGSADGYEIIDDCKLVNGNCSNAGTFPGDWRIVFKSGSWLFGSQLLFYEEMPIDIFVVGGGGAGGYGSNGYLLFPGGGGGGGGATFTVKNYLTTPNSSYSISVGLNAYIFGTTSSSFSGSGISITARNGSNGGDAVNDRIWNENWNNGTYCEGPGCTIPGSGGAGGTYSFNISDTSLEYFGNNGGAGGTGSIGSNNGYNGGNGVLAFGDGLGIGSNIRYGSGGGGGGGSSSGGDSRHLGGAGGTSAGSGGNGGADNVCYNGNAGVQYTGGGTGGGGGGYTRPYYWSDSRYTCNGSSYTSGVVMIRNARGANRCK